jgi:hypothetical protein
VEPYPVNFLDEFEALPFFGALAFGLRASLFDRICPLANVVTPKGRVAARAH